MNVTNKAQAAIQRTSRVTERDPRGDCVRDTYKNHPSNICRSIVKNILGKSFLKKPTLAVEIDTMGSVKFFGKDGVVKITKYVDAHVAVKLLQDVGNCWGVGRVYGGVFTPDGEVTLLLDSA